MIKLAISGAGGRMGCSLTRLLAEHPQFILAHALEHAESAVLGQDAGRVAGSAANQVLVSSEFDATAFDLMVDFSQPEASMAYLHACQQAGKGLVLGTTGLSEPQRQAVAAAAAHIPIVMAANTSIGVNLCAALAKSAAQVLGPITDIEIIEAHHKHKVDAPSGTALLLGRAVADALDKNLEQDGVFTRHGRVGPRRHGSIGFSTIRGGDIAGEHTVMFIGESERVEITHKATDRVIFARGALQAALWLHKKWQAGDTGLFDMQSVLQLN